MWTSASGTSSWRLRGQASLEHSCRHSDFGVLG
jgi:hypothetical protein